MVSFDQALALAVQHHQAGRLHEAGTLYRRLIDTGINHAALFCFAGQLERDTGALLQGVDLFRRSLAVNPEQGMVYFLLADSLSRLGWVADGEAVLRGALCRLPASHEVMHALGSILCGYGGGERLREAIICLKRAAAIRPEAPEIHHDLAVALGRDERMVEAIASEDRALTLRPDFAAAHMVRGNMLNECGDRDEARRALRKALALAPASAELCYNLGNTLHSRNEPEAALRSYERAIRLGLHSARLRAATVLIQLGRLEEAEAELRQAHRFVGADVASSIDMLADLYAQQKRFEEGRAVLSDLATVTAANGTSYRGECIIGVANLLLQEGHLSEAAFLLNRVAGDSSRLFTMRSVVNFRLTLNSLGATLPRPADPSPDRPRVGSSTLATHGRFAHNVLEYILIRLYAEKYGYVLETPEWVGGYYFDIDDPRPSRPLSPLYFARRIVNGLVTGESSTPPVADCDILSPLFLLEHREEYRERVQSWLKPRPLWRPFIDPVVERLRSLGDTVVALHIRRGDFITCKYPITETAWYVEWLHGAWETLKNPVLYLASDDLDGVRGDFAAFRPVSRADLADAWTGLDFLQDFHVLSHADVVGISAASGFSLLAARLNTTARLFVEPDMVTRRIRPFMPWIGQVSP